jgi:hypothetical protein
VLGAAITLGLLMAPAHTPSQALARSVGLATVLVPLLITCTPTHVLMPRYLIPLVAALAVRIVPWWQPWWAGQTAVLVLLSLNLGLLEMSVWVPHQWRQNWRAVAARIRANEQPGDGIVTLPGYCTFVLNYYLRHPLQWQEDGTLSTGDSLQYGPASFDPALLQQADHLHARLWIVMTQVDLYDPQHDTATWLVEHRSNLGTWKYVQSDPSGDIVLSLMGRR